MFGYLKNLNNSTVDLKLSYFFFFIGLFEIYLFGRFFSGETITQIWYYLALTDLFFLPFHRSTTVGFLLFPSKSIYSRQDLRLTAFLGFLIFIPLCYYLYTHLMLGPVALLISKIHVMMQAYGMRYVYLQNEGSTFKMTKDFFYRDNFLKYLTIFFVVIYDSYNWKILPSQYIKPFTAELRWFTFLSLVGSYFYFFKFKKCEFNFSHIKHDMKFLLLLISPFSFFFFATLGYKSNHYIEYQNALNSKFDKKYILPTLLVSICLYPIFMATSPQLMSKVGPDLNDYLPSPWVTALIVLSPSFNLLHILLDRYAYQFRPKPTLN